MFVCGWVYTHTHISVCITQISGTFGNHKNVKFATTWMDFEGTMLSEISQMQKDKYCMISLIGGIEKKMRQTFEYNKKGADTDTENKLVVMSGMMESGRLRQEACNKKYKLLCRK